MKEIMEEMILVSAPTKAGENFIRQLMLHHVPFAAITNNKAEMEKLKRLGVKNILMVMLFLAIRTAMCIYSKAT